MKNIVKLFIYLCLSMVTFASINLAPYEFDFNLEMEREREYSVVNTGEFLASYTIELEKKMPISKFIELKKERFILKPGEKKDFKISIKDTKDRTQGEYIGKLYILEQQKLKNMNYEINTVVNLYGYMGDIKESFEIPTLIKDEDNILIGEIENRSKRKVDVILKGLDANKNEILTRKIRVLRGQKFDLLDLGNIDELRDVKFVELETKDMKKMFEI